jgi:hypothetical protein
MTNTHLITLTTDEQFFYDNAGYSYAYGKESRSSGATRNALLLAQAEKEAKRKGWHVEWSVDQEADITPTDNYFVSGAEHWEALLFDADGKLLASLGSIDLGYAYGNSGEPAYPDTTAYARVVKAELAREALLWLNI